MKKIISGKIYDTDKARELGVDGGSIADNLHWWRERLYQKRTGEYFLHGEGGPMSRYAKMLDEYNWSGGEQILPLSAQKARQWAETHLSADQYEALFGVPDEEDGGLEALHIQLPAALVTRIRQRASQDGSSLKDCVAALLASSLDGGGHD